ncbi:unnamed protein product, partial [marine sediment metagenome]
MAWVTPTGDDGTWANPERAHDDDEETCAQKTTGADAWSTWIQLTHLALNCDKVRFYA